MRWGFVVRMMIFCDVKMMIVCHVKLSKCCWVDWCPLTWVFGGGTFSLKLNWDWKEGRWACNCHFHSFQQHFHNILILVQFLFKSFIMFQWTYLHEVMVVMMVNHGMGVHGIVRRRVHGPSLRNPSSRELFIKNLPVRWTWHGWKRLLPPRVDNQGCLGCCRSSCLNPRSGSRSPGSSFPPIQDRSHSCCWSCSHSACPMMPTEIIFYKCP